MKFYDRKAEIATLQGMHGGFCIAIVGRRRVGKTRLVKETFPDSMYLFVSEEKTEKTLAGEWVEKIGRDMYIPSLERVDEIFEYILKNTDRVVFIDEIQNLERINSALLSRFQRIIDENHDNMKLVVCGSYVSIMNRLFTSKKSPLFGRMDMVLKLEELKVGTIVDVGKDLGYGFGESIELYSIFGGMPRYYELAEKLGKKSIKDLLKTAFFSDFGPLRHEGSLVLRNEFGGEYRIYFSILDAIASGKATLSEISNEVGMKIQSTSKYIAILKDDFDLIKRVVPVNEMERTSKKGRYFIKNNFYRFWFAHVHKNLNYTEGRRWNSVLDRAMEMLPSHTAKTFEDVVCEILRKDFDRVGPWWNRKGDEIDIVALDERDGSILFGEVKWRKRPVGWKVVEELKRKSKIVQWRDKNRAESFLLVSKSGFTRSCIEKMNAEGIKHWTLKDVEMEMRDIT